MREGQQWFRNRSRLVRAAAVVSIAVVIFAAIADWSSGLTATYFIDAAWERPAYTVIDRHITTDALTGSAPVSPDQPFSVRWFGSFNARKRGTYAFTLTAEGGAGLAIEHSSPTGPVFSPVEGTVDLEEGPHAISISYSHPRGRYGIDLRMSVDGGAWTTVRSQDLAPYRRSPRLFRAVSAFELLGQLVAAIWILIALVWIVRQSSFPSSLLLVVVTGLLISAIVFDTPSWIRGPAPYPVEWQWDYRDGGTIWRAGPAFAGAIGVVLAIAFLSVPKSVVDERRRARIGLAAAAAAGLLLQLGVLHLGQGGAIASAAARTRDDIATGYFDVAAKPLETATLLDEYANMLVTLPVHPRAHPPGPVLYYRSIIAAFDMFPAASRSLTSALERLRVPIKRFDGGNARYSPRLLQAAAVVGGLGTVALSVFTCWAIAGIARASGANVLSAARAGALWALTPAALFFAPSVDAITTFLVATACFAGCRAATADANRRAAVWALGGGVLAGLALFCSLGAGPMLAAAVILIGLITIGRPISWQRSLRLGILALAGLLIVWLVPAAFGFDAVATVQGTIALHRDHYLRLDRNLWLRFNALDYSIFLGWPLIVWAVILVVRDRNWQRGKLVLAMAGVVAAIDLADVTRSEVGRLWMPIMPLTLAAIGVAASSEKTESGEWLLTASLLAMTSLVLVLYWGT